MTALGVISDNPPNSIQPRLLDGIHLRFAPAFERGFPWFGYFLFRRPHQVSDHRCVQSTFKPEWKAGPWSASRADFTGGVFSSDADLEFLNQFAPPASPKFDLRLRKYLRFDLPDGESAREFHVKLGFLGETTSAAPKQCVDFTKMKTGLYSNPYLLNKIEFTGFAVSGKRPKNCEIRKIQGTSGLLSPGQLVVKLPVGAASVEIDMMPIPSMEFSALDEEGNVIDQKTAISGGPDKQTIQLSGGVIASGKSWLRRLPVPQFTVFVTQRCRTPLCLAPSRFGRSTDTCQSTR